MRTLLWQTVVLAALANAPFVRAADVFVPVGAGGYLTQQPAGANLPPRQIYRVAGTKLGKMPTNDWWSSLAWMPFSERQFPHPLAVETGPAGLRVFYPGARITANRDAIIGFTPPPGEDVTIGLAGADQFGAALVDQFSDWFVSARFESKGQTLHTSYGHGSPYVFVTKSGGDMQVSFSQPPKIWSGDEKNPVLGVTIGERHYGLFAPNGATWSGWGTAALVCHTPRDYLTLAVLPQGNAAMLDLFRTYAYAHVVDTHVAWKYDPHTANVHTLFRVETVAREGTERGTIFALYPHQWRHTEDKLLGPEFNSVRGPMKLTAGKQFSTTLGYPGVLPCLPKLSGSDEARMQKFLQAEVAEPADPPIRDTYWEGKWLGRSATLAPIAEAYQQPAIADQLRQRVRARLERWLKAPRPDAAGKWQGGFYYDALWGTLIGYPASFGSDDQLNDHHFHYGYFIRAAAEIARQDPQWAKDNQWGGMVKLLIRDIASPQRDDRMFPFLRNFDPYAGHSWASGHAKFGDGNNNESSSEAMNAWFGLILWGEATGDAALRDLGIYLYTTEMNAIQEYWFDVHDENHPADFTPSVVTMVWGGKGANATWFTANPEAVHGINWLPIGGGSLYLGHYPAYAEKNYQALVAENGGTAWDEWPDLVWMYRALSNPADARAQFEADADTPKIEAGNSRANTLHWIQSLEQLGLVDPSITADTTCYAVFRKGKQTTYCVFDMRPQTDKPRTVTFSDGHRLILTKPGFTVGR